MKEIEPKSKLLTFKDLVPGIFHLLSPSEQLAVIQNTVIDLQGANGRIDILKPEAVDPEELKALSLLCTPQHASDFAGTFWGGYYSMPHFIDKESAELISIAVERDLWEKYIGLAYYDERVMGEMLHSVSLIAYAVNPHEDSPRPLAPGDTSLSYKEAIDGLERVKKVLVVGAFSPKSIADIWAMKNILLPEDSELFIVDIEGVLTIEAARHFGIYFINADGLSLPFPSSSIDLVLTNNLTSHMGRDGALSFQLNQRYSFLKEAARVLRRKGRLGMVEQPVLEYSKGENEILERSAEDRILLGRQLNELGYHEKIALAEIFDTRIETEKFIRSGGKTVGKTSTECKVVPLLSIIAVNNS